MLLLLWTWAILHIAMAHENVTCFQDGRECEWSDQDLVDTAIVANWQECSLLCLNSSDCVAFTFYGPSSDVIPHNSCFLFSDCKTKHPCKDCVIGLPQQDCLCSISYLGTIDASNFADIVLDVRDEATCKRLCSEDEACEVYTYYTSSNPTEPETCILLSDSGLQKTATQCDYCKTGSSQCKADQECEAGVFTDSDGVPFNDYIFANSSFSATLMTAEKDCYREVQALAIGGGGGGNGHGGGGSGYINFKTLQIRRSMEVSVGQGGEPSVIKVADQSVLTGYAGETPGGQRGGTGYSGGGYSDGDGGENGGDGEGGSNGTGGRGSGFDLTTVQIKNFIISPGKAGTTSGTNGGGGGGVVVNEAKPSGGNSTDGEGYGGGGSNQGLGLPGCVLIDL